MGEETYSFVELREIAHNGEETDVLEAVRAFKDIELFPFVVHGMLRIAQRRNQNEVVKELYKIKSKWQQERNVVYYPNEVYQIESLVQLILEDLNSDRVYVHYSDDTLCINATLKQNSNRSGAHHAEMAKLHCALGIGDLIGKNALDIVLEDNFKLPVGVDHFFKSFSMVRDTLLTYELTTLLVSQQNIRYYLNNKGAFHPKTGKGAANGVIALLQERLFTDYGTPYQIQVHYDEHKNCMVVHTNRADTAQNIASTLQEVLTISPKKIVVDHNDIKIRFGSCRFNSQTATTCYFL